KGSSDRSIRPVHNLRGDLAECAVERTHISLVAATCYGSAGRELPGRANLAIAVVQKAGEDDDFGHSALVGTHAERPDFGYDLIVDGEALARRSDPCKAPRTLNRFCQPCLHDQRQPVCPLCTLEIFDGVRPG